MGVCDLGIRCEKLLKNHFRVYSDLLTSLSSLTALAARLEPPIFVRG